MENSLEFHPIANLFPLLQGEDFTVLVADISEHGLHEPVWLYQGKIIDGRNRYRACLEADIPLRTRDYTGDSPTQFAVSLNLQRRHLTYDQRVGLGLKLLPLLAAEAKERQQQHGETAPGRGATLPPKSEEVFGEASKQAAQQVGVGRTAITEMLAAAKENPALADELVNGETTVRDTRKKRRRIAQHAHFAKLPTPTLDGMPRYPLLYVDPPWRYDYAESESRAVENQYPTLEVDAICALPVAALTADDCLLFLWATSPKLEEAFRVLNAWGFSYRTCMVWVKDKIGMGYYARQQHELLLIAKKGEPPTPDPANRPPSVILGQRTNHSAKPEGFYAAIERMYPGVRKLELFARSPREGWDRWGNQA